MSRSKKKRRRLGDVIELPTKGGLAYIQFTNDEDGHLVRVLPGVFRKPCDDLKDLVDQKERFFAEVHLPEILRRRGVEIVGNFPVPSWAQGIPLMKAPLFLSSGAISQKWFLQDGTNQWYVGDLLPEQEELSINEFLDYDELVERIVSGWSPRDYVKKEQILSPEDIEEERDLIEILQLPDEVLEHTPIEDPPGPIVRHFFYCPEKSKAKAMARALQRAGYETDVAHFKEDEDLPWHVVALQPSDGRNRDEHGTELEKLAAEHGVVYDGWEVGIVEDL